MLGGASTFSINQSLYSSMPYDSATAFAPITQMSTNSNVLIVNPSIPGKSVKELIAYGKANPGKLNYASSGAGGSIHLSAEMFKSMTGAANCASCGLPDVGDFQRAHRQWVAEALVREAGNKTNAGRRRLSR